MCIRGENTVYELPGLSSFNPIWFKTNLIVYKLWMDLVFWPFRALVLTKCSRIQAELNRIHFSVERMHFFAFADRWVLRYCGLFFIKMPLKFSKISPISELWYNFINVRGIKLNASLERIGTKEYEFLQRKRYNYKSLGFWSLYYYTLHGVWLQRKC